jgi:hypothetical protein
MKQITVLLNCKKVKAYFKIPKLTTGKEIAMFKSGAKLYRRGVNKFLIAGYAYDGKDVVEAVKEIIESGM